jgi:hypothetical protein
MLDNGCKRLKGLLTIMSAKSLLVTNAILKIKEKSAKKKGKSLPGTIKFLTWRHLPRAIFALKTASPPWLDKSRETL